MASKISTFCCLLLISFLIVCGEEATVPMSLGFTALSPPEVILARNHPLLLNCSGYSDEGPLHISWLFQDNEINDKHFTVFANGSLYNEKLPSQKKKERRWEGNYYCRLKNRVGILVSRPIRVIFARMSKTFISKPQLLSTKEGGFARFSCQINAVPPAVISWFRDGIELPQNDNRYTILPSGTLQISGVTLSDAGNYKCLCENVARQRESPEAALIVEARTEEFQPSVFLNPAEDITAISSKSAVLECFADGFPVVEISWKREDGQPISEHLLKNGNLHFPKVQVKDAGSYICTAKAVNKDNNQMAVAIQKVSLNVHVPPKFTKVPRSQGIPSAQTVRFDCEVEGIPAVSIHWLKNGEQLYINGRIKLKFKNTLVVSQTATTDSGIYQCVASNSAGVSVSSARLIVHASSDQPQPPSNLKARTASSSSIYLSWDPVISPPIAPIQAYTVHYVPFKGGIEQDAVAGNNSLLVDRLKPYTNYTFYVRAYSNKSASEPSQTIVQMTGEDVPLVAPKIRLTSLSPTTLHVQWDELPLEKARGIITGHRIYYRKHKQASSTVHTSNVATEYTITGLTPKQKYDVRVLAGTKVGFPNLLDENWPWHTYEMPPASDSKVPFPPTLHLNVINNTALEVKWNMSSDNPYPISGYYLSYREQNKPLKRPISLPANTSMFLLTDLTPQSWYEVYLVAYNKKGESREAVRNIITFSGDNPDIETVKVVEPPHHLEAEPLSSSSIRLTWKAPETSRNISYYTVRYHPVLINGLVNDSYIYYRSTNNEVVILDLKPFTLYEFSVRSHDVDKRQGPFSPPVECKTNEALPSVPQDITWTPIDANSIRLNWQAPKYPNGIITAYYILYSTKNDNKPDSWKIKEEKGTESTSLITGLVSNTLYYFRMRAQNGAGISPPTPIMRINIPVRHNSTKPPSPESIEAEPNSPLLGIIIGIGIGLVFVIICVAIICRNRCCSTDPDPSTEGRNSNCCGNGYIPHLNGHILGNASTRGANIENRELENFTQLNSYPNGSNQHHLDTKGGYPNKLCNGKANGMPRQMLKNSKVPVGNHQSGQLSGHIVPPSSKQLLRYTSSDCKVSENGWGDESGDVTSSTVLLDADENLQSDEHSFAECSGNGTSKQCKSDSPSTSNGAKTKFEAESSCNTESKDDSFNKLVSKTHTPCTVPPTSSLSHLSPSDCCSVSAENDQNYVPSIDSADGNSPCPVEKNRKSSGEEQSSLPFSVNAFLSPLAGPRFSQSSNPNSAGANLKEI